MSIAVPRTLHDYADAVASGEILAGKYHRLSAQRHLRDMQRQETAAFPYLFRQDLAERFFRFAGQMRHYKGRQWAGQHVQLTLSQQFTLGSLWGWVRADTGLRRFRTSYKEVPRKNGKSLESAIVVIYGTFFDGEDGAEGYCCATKRDQAGIVFGDAKKLVQKNPGLRRRIAVHARNLSHARSSSKIEPLSKDHDSMDGLNPQIVNIDEVHKLKDRGIIDVMETAMGARLQAIMYQITTAGDDLVSPCGDQHDYACKILEQTLVDESFFAFIAHADIDDDWLDERTWRKANPHYGISVNPEDMRALATKAQGIPSAAAAFKQKRLNLWVNASAPCLSVDGWRKGQTLGWRRSPRTWAVEELAGEPCYAGLDNSSKIDLCSLSLVFPPRPGRSVCRVLQRIWTPADTLKDRARRDRAPYQIWVDQGWLTAVPGTRIDHTLIRAALVEAAQHFDIELLGYDPWHVDQLANDLVDKDGFTEEQLVPIPQTYAGMSSACLRVQADILAGEIDTGGCPVTAWAVSNAVDQRDGKDNMMFTKKKSRGRIDPIISATIGIACWLRQTPADSTDDQLFFLGGRS